MTQQISPIEACHQLDGDSAKVMKTLTKMIGPAYDLGLKDELEAIETALTAFHEALTAKFNELSGRIN